MGSAGICLIGLGVMGPCSFRIPARGPGAAGSGQPVPGARVLLFNLEDLRTAPLAVTTDRSGRLALPLATLPGPCRSGSNLG